MAIAISAQTTDIAFKIYEMPLKPFMTQWFLKGINNRYFFRSQKENLNFSIDELKFLKTSELQKINA